MSVNGNEVAWCICGAAYPAELKSCPECELDQQTTFLSQAEQQRRTPQDVTIQGCAECGVRPAELPSTLCRPCLEQH